MHMISPKSDHRTRPAGSGLDSLLGEIGACRLCAGDLPPGLAPRPVLRAAASARVMIVGQAPGRRVHETGIPWNDASGRRLRQWLDLDADTFYDARRIAIVPVGFCYPGTNPNGGDLPPRPECAPRWHPPLRTALGRVELTLLVGRYAQTVYLGRRGRATMTETVRNTADYLPEFFPTPHPSWRTTHWLKRNPWFEAELVPEMRRRVHDLVGATVPA